MFCIVTDDKCMCHIEMNHFEEEGKNK
ncbi:unnamed protein product [Nezara viridula]|uniref:Uncharacterized protein n=1 Tax=Nezara viridula TaxID=85310 RepID=A0A9P0E9X0_NEZVI|nr:unnamed protein product [Nezara viridula]